MRLLRVVAAAALAGCSGSGVVPPAPFDAGCASDCSSSEAGDAPPITKSPSSVDGGVSAPCADTTNCHVGLECIDGACFQ